MLENFVLSNNDYKECKNETRIFIKSLDGELFSFSVKNHDLIRDIKLKIYDKIGLNVDEQILYYQSEILDDMMTLNDYEIINDSLIDIIGRLKGGKKIVIKLAEGTRIEIKIKLTDKVKDLKLKIQEKKGMPPDEQILVYQGKVLDDDEKTLVGCQIRGRPVINVVAKLRIRIFAKTLDENTVEIDVQKFDEIIDLKKKIQEKIGFHRDEQILVYQDEILENDKTIDYYQICEKSVINIVDILRIQILFKATDGQTIEMKVERFQKIIDLKYKIKEKLGLSVNKQKLIYRNEILNDDNKSINQYEISDKSVIDIVAKMVIHITTSGGRIATIEMDATDKIIDLKYQIEEKLELNLNKQILVYQNEILDDDDKTINEYQICDQSMIYLRRYEIEISVKLQNDKIFTIKSLISDKIIDLKLKINDQTGLQPDEQILIYKNEILDANDKTIYYYRICHQSIISLEAKLKNIDKQIFVKTIDEETVTIIMKKFDKIIDLKHEIEKQTKLHRDKQILIYQGRILNDDEKTIDQYEISDQSIVNVVAKMIIFVSIGDRITMVDIYKTDKIKDLKYKIQEKLGFNTDKWKLVFHDKILDDDADDRTIDEYQICDQSMIGLRCNQIEISITMSNNTHIAVRAQVLDNIEDIKKKIECQTELQSNNQILIYQGVQLDNNKTIDEYQLCNQSVIHLQYGMVLFIKTLDGRTIICEVKKSDRIIDMKMKIQEKIGLHWYEQILVYNGAMLENCERIDQYKICDKSIVTIVARLRCDEIQIIINKINGRTILIDVQKSKKVIDIKKKIEQRLGLQRDEQILVYQDEILDDDDEKIVDEYKIWNQSVIYVSSRNEWS